MQRDATIPQLERLHAVHSSTIRTSRRQHRSNAQRLPEAQPGCSSVTVAGRSHDSKQPSAALGIIAVTGSWLLFSKLTQCRSGLQEGGQWGPTPGG